MVVCQRSDGLVVGQFGRLIRRRVLVLGLVESCRGFEGDGREVFRRFGRSGLVVEGESPSGLSSPGLRYDGGLREAPGLGSRDIEFELGARILTLAIRIPPTPVNPRLKLCSLKVTDTSCGQWMRTPAANTVYGHRLRISTANHQLRTTTADNAVGGFGIDYDRGGYVVAAVAFRD